MRYLVLMSLFVCATVAAAQEWRATPATLIRDDGSQVEAFVFSETYDEIIFSSKTAPEAKGPIKRKEIAEVLYDRIADPDYNRALGAMRGGEWQKAITHLSKSKDLPFQYVAQESALGLAQSYAALGQFAEAAQALTEFLAKSPNHPKTLDMMSQKIDLYLQGKDVAAATKEISALESLPGAGPAARAVALFGRSQVAKAADKEDEVLSFLNEAMAAVDEVGGEWKGRIGGELLSALSAKGDVDASLAVAEKLFYASINPTDLAKVHFEAAKVYEAKDQWQKAFDHYLVASIMPDADVSIIRSAFSGLLSLVSSIEKRDDVSAEEKQMYRTAVSRL